MFNLVGPSAILSPGSGSTLALPSPGSDGWTWMGHQPSRARCPEPAILLLCSSASTASSPATCSSCFLLQLQHLSPQLHNPVTFPLQLRPLLITAAFNFSYNYPTASCGITVQTHPPIRFHLQLHPPIALVSRYNLFLSSYRLLLHSLSSYILLLCSLSSYSIFSLLLHSSLAITITPPHVAFVLQAHLPVPCHLQLHPPIALALPLQLPAPVALPLQLHPPVAFLCSYNLSSLLLHFL